MRLYIRELGVTVAEASSVPRAGTEGVVVVRIEPSGTAAQAQLLHMGDIILGINGRPVDTPSEAHTAIRASVNGNRLSLHWQIKPDAQTHLFSGAQGRRASLYVIYDASYLIHGGAVFNFKVHASCQTNVVCEETLSEIENKYGRIAGAARGTLLRLHEAQSENGEWGRYLQPKASDIVEPEVLTERLDADSVTDRLLIAYGRHLLAQGHANTVAIATRDGGIAYSVGRLRAREGLQLYDLYDTLPYDFTKKEKAVFQSLKPFW